MIDGTVNAKNQYLAALEINMRAAPNAEGKYDGHCDPAVGERTALTRQAIR
jgi:hypothetical protein